MSSRGGCAANQPRWTRDNRIRANHKLIDALVDLWDRYPDQRFGQLVMNLSREPGGFADTWEWGHSRWLDRIGQTAMEWLEAEGVGDVG